MVIGDLMLDRYIWGSVERISSEAPVPIVNVLKNEDRLGGAANAARNLANLGAQVSLFGFVGGDKEGEILKQLLRKHSIHIDGVLEDRSRPTSLKTRVIAHAQQVVRIDREQISYPKIALQQRMAALITSNLKKFKAVLISDYGKGSISEVIMAPLSKAVRKGELSLRKRPLVVDPNPSSYHFYSGMSVAKPNRREAEEASGVKIRDKDSALKAGRLLLRKWNAEMMLISLGEDGLLIVPSQGKKGVLLETLAQEVHDVSGAGDTVTALFAAALGAGAQPVLAGQLANIGAGVVVSEVGTVAVEASKLKREIERLAHT